MADRYIDQSYVFACMEADTVRSILARRGTSLNVLIEQGTALVQSYLRNSGYTVPSTQDPSTITEENLKLGVMACVRQALCGMPSSNLALPNGWETHPERLALVGILNGDAILRLPQSKAQAPGGALFSDSSSTSERRQRTSRCELKGF